MSDAIFLGSKDAGLEALKAIRASAKERLVKAITFDDRADSRSVLNEFSSYCSEKNIPLSIIEPKNLSIELKAHQGAKVFVIGWYSILQENLLSRNDFFGMHYSPLPKYRGNAPLVWQIINGESEIGLSLFKFSLGIDDGEIVAHKKFPLLNEDDISTVLAKANFYSKEILEEQVKKILNGEVTLTLQDHSKASYCSLRIPEDGKINWNLSAQEIFNFVRAQTTPYPGAFTVNSKGEKIKIIKCEIDNRTIYAPTGAIVERNLNYVTIKCGNGAIKILKAKNSNNETIRTIFPSIKERLL